MNEYIVVAIVECVAVISLYSFVRWRFGNGLLSKLFGVVIPSIAMCAYIGVVLGKQGITAVGLAVAVCVATVCIVFMTVVIQRFIVSKIRAEAESVLGVSSSLATTSQEAAASAEEQAAAVSQVSSSVEEVHRMSQSTAENSQEVVRAADQAVEQGQLGLNSVRELFQVMERFSQATDFVQIVGEVAEQSNLLAVNAGIEAAKAGEFGRGFSVVASEVRNLAEQSKDAARQIREAIEQTQTGKLAITSTDSVISSLGTVLRDTSDRARQISGASVQQSAGLKQISDAMMNLNQGGKDTAVSAQQIEKAGTDLIEISRRLAILINGQASLERA